MKRAILALILLAIPFAMNCSISDAPTTATAERELAVCGDGSCAPGVENCGNCPGDCPCASGTACSLSQCVPVCGNGQCFPGVENCGNCATDCPCPGGTTCQNQQCRPPDPCDGDICCRKPWLCCEQAKADGESELVVCAVDNEEESE